MTGRRGCRVALLQARDRLEQLALARGEPVSTNALPPGLLWTASGPMTQRVYFWEWAREDSRLYGRLHDDYGAGGCWRLETSPEVLRLYRKILLEAGSKRSTLE
jgi:hypothetical protein